MRHRQTMFLLQGHMQLEQLTSIFAITNIAKFYFETLAFFNKKKLISLLLLTYNNLI